tara:strand:- start:1152 stop:1820 length:669 start_codon:yes stop_codon:yes gene_type:complete
VLTQENLLILAFEDDFRKEFPSLSLSFEALDKMGGRNCKSCSRHRQKLVLRDMYNRVVTEKLTDKYQEFYNVKVASGGIHTTKQVQQVGPNTNYAKMPLDRDQFICCLLFPEVRKLLHVKLGTKVEELLGAILNQGVYSKNTEKQAKGIYPSIFSDDVFGDFSALLNKLGIMEKVRSNPTPLKVKILQSNTSELEDNINRFILGKNVVSIQKDGLSALVTYR